MAEPKFLGVAGWIRRYQAGAAQASSRSPLAWFACRSMAGGVMRIGSWIDVSGGRAEFPVGVCSCGLPEIGYHSTVETVPLETRFEAAAAALLRRGEGVLIGVSGGADSVALLRLLQDADVRCGWRLRLRVAHLDHQLRGADAEADAAFVAELATALGIPYTCEARDIAALAAERRKGIEETGRAERLAFYERVCAREGLTAVCLGHHADDQVETVLHHIMRGTGLRGLAGMPATRALRAGSDVRLVRPLLPFRREELAQHLRGIGQAWREDASNTERRYARNRIRHDVLAGLREQYTGVDAALARIAARARSAVGRLDEMVAATLDRITVQQDAATIVLDSISLADESLSTRAALMEGAFRRLNAPRRRMTAWHYQRLAELASQGAGEWAIDLPAGVQAKRCGDRLTIQVGARSVAAGRIVETLVALDGATVVPGAGVTFRVNCVDAKGDRAMLHSTGPGWVEQWIDAGAVRPPLIARARRAGDRFRPLGMGEEKKLSDFLVDEKIDRRRRERTILLCDQEGPIWVVPLRIDERVRVKEESRRVLRIRAEFEAAAHA